MFRRITFATLAVTCLLAVTGATVSASTVHASSAQLPPKGDIWYGTKYVRQDGNLKIQGRKSVFHTNQTIAWVAHFKQAGGTHKITITLWTRKNGKTSQVWQGTSTLKNKKSDEFANKTAVKNFVTLGAKTPGAYALSYSRGQTLLAWGYFTLKK